MNTSHLAAIALAGILPLGCASGEEDTRAEAHDRARVLFVEPGPHADGPHVRELRSEGLHLRDLHEGGQHATATAPRVRSAYAPQDTQWLARKQPLAVMRLHEGPLLGVSVDATPDGLRVTEVEDGSLAQAAGVQADDVLLRVGERKVHSVNDVRAGLAAYRPGDDVSVAVIRPGTGIVELSAPLPEPPARKDGPLADGSRGGFLGVELDDMPGDGPRMRTRIRTGAADQPTDEPTDKPADAPAGKAADRPADKVAERPADRPTDKPADKPADEPTGKTSGSNDEGPGVRVAGVVPDSAAWYAGLERGDRLLAIDGEALSNGQDLVGSVASRAPGTLVELRVLRDGAERTVQVRLGRRSLGGALSRFELPRLRSFGGPDGDTQGSFNLHMLPDQPFGFGMDGAFDFGDLLQGIPTDLHEGSRSVRVEIDNDRMTIERDGMTSHYTKNEAGEWVPDASGATPDGPRTR
jgi:membrane-associated protease RseP (regulator of RpoE activity)